MHIVVRVSHRGPVTINFKWSVQLVLRLENWKIAQLQVFAWLVYPKPVPLGKYELIYLYYMYIVIRVSHSSPMIIYFKWSVQLVLRLEKAKNRPNASFCLTSVPKTSTTWQIWVDLFILYVYRRTGITQKPMTIYFNNRVWLVQLVLFLEKAKKRPKVSFCLTSAPIYITTWLIWVDLFILYVYSRIGIT